MGAIPHLMVNTGQHKLIVPKRIFRQHNSLVVVLPVLIREKLKIVNGDYLLFEWSASSKFVKLKKFKGTDSNETQSRTDKARAN